MALLARELARARSRKYRANNLEKVRTCCRNYERRSRLSILMLLGGKCELCSNNDSRVLQVDHVNGGGSKEIRNVATGSGAYLRRIFRNPENYQLLCANCNWIKRWERGEGHIV